jgi:hypothetical protein
MIHTQPGNAYNHPDERLMTEGGNAPARRPSGASRSDQQIARM